MGADQEGRKRASSIFRDQKKGQKRAGVKRKKSIAASNPFMRDTLMVADFHWTFPRLKEESLFSHYVWHSLKLSQIVRLLQGKECSRGILIPDVPASFFSHLSLSLSSFILSVEIRAVLWASPRGRGQACQPKQSLMTLLPPPPRTTLILPVKTEWSLLPSKTLSPSSLL